MEHCRLGLAEVMQGGETFLASVAALARTAERKLDARSGAVAVDEQLSRADTSPEPHLPCAVARPGGRHQAVVGAVGERHGIVLVIEGERDEDRSEDLLPGDGVVARRRTE